MREGRYGTRSVEYHAKVSGFVIRGYSRVMFAKVQTIRFSLLSSDFWYFFISYRIIAIVTFTKI